MAETAEATETTEETTVETTETTEATETAKQNQTLESIVKEEQGKRDKADTEAKEAEVKKTEGTKEAKTTEKGKEHKTASERVQQAVNEKNEAIKRAEGAETAITSMKTEVQSLRDELKGITEQLSKGEISKKEAAEQAQDAQELFQKVLGKIEMPDDLKPYKDTLAKIAFDMADALVTSKVSPLEEKLKEAEGKLQEKEELETAKMREDFVSKNLENYKTVAQEYPYLFEAEPDKNGMPVMKPDFEKEALQFAGKYNVQIGEVDGNPVYHNPVLSTKEGLQMLFGHLNRSIDAAQKAKEKIDKEKEAVNRAKKARVESPESHSSTSAKKLTLEQIIQEEIDKRK